MRAIGGRYRMLKELRLPWRGREVLATIRAAHFDTACCGGGGCGTAEVAGFVVAWHAHENATVVEPILDTAARDELADLLRRTEHVLDIRFVE